MRRLPVAMVACLLAVATSLSGESGGGAETSLRLGYPVLLGYIAQTEASAALPFVSVGAGFRHHVGFADIEYSLGYFHYTWQDAATAIINDVHALPIDAMLVYPFALGSVTVAPKAGLGYLLLYTTATDGNEQATGLSSIVYAKAAVGGSYAVSAAVRIELELALLVGQDVNATLGELDLYLDPGIRVALRL